MSNPPQHQDHQPGDETEMNPAPESFMEKYKSADRHTGKVVIVTGGDSGIGRAVAIGFAKEGADVAIVYLDESRDAHITKKHIEAAGRKCLTFSGDIGRKDFCQSVVDQTVAQLGRLDVLVNNAAEQHECESIEDITEQQLKRTFDTNIFSMFYMIQAAMPHLQKGACILNTTSITAYRGSPTLLDYSSTKGAILALTRSLAGNLLNKGIRVNAVAPGPIWTPLIPASFDAEKTAKFGEDVPMGRPGQPDEVAPCYLFLASDDASYITGQVMHPNGGSIINT